MKYRDSEAHYFANIYKGNDVNLNPSPLKATVTKKILLAIKLYETRRLSLGKAAELADYSKRAFIEVLGHHEVSVFNYSVEDLNEEMEW